ncbi:hypothetical protein KAI04_03475 [Candidatus Pacearchaeota archaeon]|nr:hypothetical protein [Candidatus Pacearchaeota archaeon]
MTNEQNMSDVFSRNKIKLERLLKEVNLTPQMKEVIQVSLDFAYAAAYSLKTCEKDESDCNAQIYIQGYESVKRLIDEKKTSEPQ